MTATQDRLPFEDDPSIPSAEAFGRATVVQGPPPEEELDYEDDDFSGPHGWFDESN